MALAHEVDNPENETSGRLSADGRKVTVSFIDAKAGNKPCDASYTANAIMNSLVVAFWVTPHWVPTKWVCDLVGYPPTATVTLPSPLGGRPLIDTTDDAPVLVTTPSQ